jgi:hypothetical protein
VKTASEGWKLTMTQKPTSITSPLEMIASSSNNGIPDSNMNNINKTMTNATVGSEDILMGRGGLTNSVRDLISLL